MSLRKSLFLLGANSLFLTLAPFQPFSLPPPSPAPPFSSLRGPDTGTHIGADFERRSHLHLSAFLRLHLRRHSSSIDVSHVHFDALAGSISMLHIGPIMQVKTCIHAIMTLNQSQYSTVLNYSTSQLFCNIYCSDMPPQEWASASDACTAAWFGSISVAILVPPIIFRYCCLSYFVHKETGPGILDVTTDSRTCLIHYCARNVRKSQFALFAPFGLPLDKLTIPTRQDISVNILILLSMF